MSDEDRITDADLADWARRLGKIASPDTMIGAVIAEVQHHRSALRRLDELQRRMGVSRDHTVLWWAAELRAAITGRKFLYRCPEHGDRSRLSQRHEGGVCCGAPLETPSTSGLSQHSSTRGSRWGSCTKTAILVGEVDEP